MLGSLERMDLKTFEVATNIAPICRDKAIRLDLGVSGNKEIGYEMFPRSSGPTVGRKRLSGQKGAFLYHGIMGNTQIIQATMQFLKAGKERRKFCPNDVGGNQG